MKFHFDLVVVALLALASGFWLGQIYEHKKLSGPRIDPDALFEINIAGAPSRGKENAPVTIVEFTDYECPFCQRARLVIDRLVAENPGLVRHVIKHNPLDIHPLAPTAAMAAMAAGQQGRFWEMHASIFDDQEHLSIDDLRARAAELGLDMEQFERDLALTELADRILSDQEEARDVGVTGTPTFFLNGRVLIGAASYDEFKARIEEASGESIDGFVPEG